MSDFLTQLLLGKSNCINTNNDNRSNNQHVFLQGPTNSNKTTITMSISHKLSNDNTCDYCQQSTESTVPCHCCSILYIIPKSKKGSISPTPLYYKQETNRDGTFWKEDNLKRIHIKYISNVRTLISYILRLPILNKKCQPTNGIIVEDVHEFFMGEDVKKNVLTIDDTMKLIEVMVLVISTANALSQKNEKAMITLFTINNACCNIASIKNIVSNYITTYLTIQPTSSVNNNNDWLLSVDDEAGNKDDHVRYNQVTNIATSNGSENYPKEKQLQLHFDLENDLLIWDDVKGINTKNQHFLFNA